MKEGLRVHDSSRLWDGSCGHSETEPHISHTSHRKLPNILVLWAKCPMESHGLCKHLLYTEPVWKVICCPRGPSEATTASRWVNPDSFWKRLCQGCACLCPWKARFRIWKPEMSLSGLKYKYGPRKRPHIKR